MAEPPLHCKHRGACPPRPLTRRPAWAPERAKEGGMPRAQSTQPKKPARKQRQRGSWISRLLRDLHPKHPFWGKVLAPLDWLWRFVWQVWTTVVVGGLIVNILISLGTTGTSGITNPSAWPV